MSRAEEARARLAGLSAKAKTPPNTSPGEDQPAGTSDERQPPAAQRTRQPAKAHVRAAAAPPRTDAVRTSVDWLPADFRRLKRTADETAEQLGLARVHTSTLTRAAVTMVLNDPDLYARLQDELSHGAGQL